jgi:uncharacterized protein (TIGR03067 family)
VDDFIRFNCPGCGKSVKARPEHAGRRVKCPAKACGQVSQVPVPMSLDSEPGPETLSLDLEPISPQRTSPVSPPPRARRAPEDEIRPERSPVLPLVGVAVLCLLAAGAIAGWYLTRDGDPPADNGVAANSNPPAAPPAPPSQESTAPKAPPPTTTPEPKPQPVASSPKPEPNSSPSIASRPSAAPASAPSPATKKKLARIDPELEGTWELDRIFFQNEGGTQSYLAVSNKHVMTIRGNEMSVVHESDGKETTTRYIFETDATRNPKQYTRTLMDVADGKGTTGIYSVENGALRMCFQADGKPPEDFVVRKDDPRRRNLFEFIRARKTATPPPPVVQSKAAPDVLPDGWKTFTSKSGGFTVDLPPESSADEKDRQVSIQLKGGKDSYQISWSEIDADDLKKMTTDQILDRRRDQIVQVLRPPVKSELQADKKVTAGKHTGRDFEIKKTGLDAGGIVITDTITMFRGRAFVVGSRLYLIYSLGEPAFISSKETTRVLESLEFQ